jgi:hypothetical protein
MENGDGLQTLYRLIDREVKEFHTSNLDAPSNYQIARINYVDLGLSTEEAIATWKTYKADNPLYYWLSNTLYTAGQRNIILCTDSDYAKGKTREYYNELVYTQIKNYASKVDKEESIYRIALAYHDLIVGVVDYAYDDSGAPQSAPWAHNIIGVFAEKGVVCEGYAKTFQILLNYTGVENLFVTGTSSGGSHAWSLVRLDDGNWYWYDLTWDDVPTSDLGVQYNYFCVNDSMNVGTSSNQYTFLDTHVYELSTGTGADFQYALPERSDEPYSDENQLLLNDTISYGECDYAVVGYDVVELEVLGGSGKVSIPESISYDQIVYTVISVGELTEKNNATVTSIELSEAVKYVDSLFNYNQCPLDYIYVDEENEYFASQDGVLFTKDFKTLLYYPKGNTRKEYVVPDETEKIANAAFYSCPYLQKVDLGENVKVLGQMAFASCTELTQVTMSSAMTTIGGWAFFCCMRLSKFSYGDTAVAWQYISKGSDWNYGTRNYTVVCTDGSLQKS